MDRGAWSATVHRVTKSRSQLKWPDTHTRMYSWLLSWWVSQNPTLGSLDVEAPSKAPCYLKVNSGVVHSACDDFVPLPSQPAHISSPSSTSSPQPGPWGEHMWAVSTSWAHQLASHPSAFPEFPPALYSTTLLSQPRPWPRALHLSLWTKLRHFPTYTVSSRSSPKPSWSCFPLATSLSLRYDSECT